MLDFLLGSPICNIISHFRVNHQQQTILAGHGTSVTAAVEILNLSCLQVPRRYDGHRSLVVTAKESGDVIVGVPVEVLGVDIHPSQCIIGNHVVIRIFIQIAVCSVDVQGCTLVIDADLRVPGDGYAVAAAIDIAESSAVNIHVGPGQLGLVDAGQGLGYFHVIAFVFIGCGIPDCTGDENIPLLGILGVFVVAVSSAEELTDEEVLACCFCIGTYKGIVAAQVCYVVAFVQLSPSRLGGRADGSRYVVTAIDGIDDDIVFLGTDTYESVSADIRLSCTAIYLSGNGYLCCCAKRQQ